MIPLVSRVFRRLDLPGCGHYTGPVLPAENGRLVSSGLFEHQRMRII
jgi:hypothetical protein